MLHDIRSHRTAQDGRARSGNRWEASWVTRLYIVLIGVAVFQLFPLVWLLFSLKQSGSLRSSSAVPSDESALGELREGMECRQHQRLFSEQRLDYRCRHCAHGHFGKSRYLRDYENEVEGRSFVLGLWLP